MRSSEFGRMRRLLAALAVPAAGVCMLALPHQTHACTACEIGTFHALPENWEEIATHQDVQEDPNAPTKDYGPPKTKFAAGPAMHARRQPEGVLSGRIVYLAAGHGWTWSNANDTNPNVWYTQRGNNNSVVEDYGNLDQMTLMAHYVWNAGGTVVTTRPVGFQPIEIVIDQSDPQVSYTGTWSDSSGTPYYGDPGDSVTYRFAFTETGSETATARYTPNITEPGIYPVYTWVLNSGNRVRQLYRIRHAGGVVETRVDHRRVGKGWVWLGNYYFEQGTNGWVEISNNKDASDPAGSVVIADAIRFGNGMGDVDFGEGVSGFPREEECSKYWAQVSTGTPAQTSVFAPGFSTHQNDNVGTPPRWVAYMNNETDGAMTDRAFISFHSNAGGGRGADGLYNNSTGNRTPNQAAFAELLGREINENMRQLDSLFFSDYTPWTTKTSHTLSFQNFGEINANSINNEMDATLIEVAYHSTSHPDGSGSDAIYLRDPRARRMIARATLRGLVRYFNQFGGGAMAMPPDEPRNLRALNDPAGTGNIILSWDPPAVIASTEPGTPGNVTGDPATGYAIYVSSAGNDFELMDEVSAPTTSYTITGLTANMNIYAWVTATNAGGESFPSNVAGASVNTSGRPPVLIVDGFNRNHSSNSFRQTVSGISGRPNLGTFRRVIPRQINDFSYAVPHGNSLTANEPLINFDYVKNEAVESQDVDLTDYHSVFWILGEESTADETFSAAEQPLVEAFLAGGGNLFLSGAEIGWHLGRPAASAPDKAFMENTLKATYVADSSETYNVAGNGGSMFAGLSFSFDDGSNGMYNALFPDVLAPEGPNAQSVMTYVGGIGGTAATRYDGTSEGRGKIVFLGFPFETITTKSDQDAIMTAVLDFFQTPLSTKVSDWMLLY